MCYEQYCTMKRIRILHTADLHLDASFAALGVNGRTGNELRRAQRHVLTRMLERARDWPADLVLIAGDLFDNATTRDETAAFVADALEQLAPIPVYIAPGNRDPYTQDSPYALSLWPDNVTVFEPGNWQRIDHAVLPLAIHGIGCDGSDDSGAWFNELRVEADGRVHLALAHGTERAHQPPDSKCFAPFDAAAIAHDNLAYAALGHFHTGVIVAENDTTVIGYPGSPQGRSFKEHGKRSFLEVVIEHNDVGAPKVQTTPISCAHILFERYTCALKVGQDPQQAVEQLAKSIDGDPAQMAVHLRAIGVLPPPIYPYIDALHAAAQSHFFHVEVENAVEALEGPPLFAGQRTCLSQFNEMMAARMADATDAETGRFEAYARDLGLKACRSNALPKHTATDPLS